MERTILDKNYRELQRMAQDTLDDAVLIGCGEAQMRDALRRLIDALANSYGRPRRNATPENHPLAITEG